jgi:hypothetical protein
VAVISDKDQVWKPLAEQEAEIKQKMGQMEPAAAR